MATMSHKSDYSLFGEIVTSSAPPHLSDTRIGTSSHDGSNNHGSSSTDDRLSTERYSRMYGGGTPELSYRALLAYGPHYDLHRQLPARPPPPLLPNNYGKF